MAEQIKQINNWIWSIISFTTSSYCYLLRQIYIVLEEQNLQQLCYKYFQLIVFEKPCLLRCYYKYYHYRWRAVQTLSCQFQKYCDFILFLAIILPRLSFVAIRRAKWFFVPSVCSTTTGFLKALIKEESSSVFVCSNFLHQLPQFCFSWSKVLTAAIGRFAIINRKNRASSF